MTATIHQLHPDPAERARKALDEFVRAGKATLASIVEYGAALQEGRDQHSADQTFGKWIKQEKLDAVKPFNHRPHRWAAMQIAVHTNSCGRELSACPKF